MNIVTKKNIDGLSIGFVRKFGEKNPDIPNPLEYLLDNISVQEPGDYVIVERYGDDGSFIDGAMIMRAPGKPYFIFANNTSVDPELIAATFVAASEAGFERVALFAELGEKAPFEEALPLLAGWTHSPEAPLQRIVVLTEQEMQYHSRAAAEAGQQWQIYTAHFYEWPGGILPIHLNIAKSLADGVWIMDLAEADGPAIAQMYSGSSAPFQSETRYQMFLSKVA